MKSVTLSLGGAPGALLCDGSDAQLSRITEGSPPSPGANTRLTGLPRLQNDAPSKAEGDRGGNTQKPSQRARGKARTPRTDGHGRQPPGKTPPPAAQGADGDDAAAHAALDQALREIGERRFGEPVSAQIKQLAIQIAALASLSVDEMTRTLGVLIAQARALQSAHTPPRGVTAPFETIFLDPLDTNIEAVLKAIEPHLVRSPQFDDKNSCLEIAGCLSALTSYSSPGTAACMATLLERIESTPGGLRTTAQLDICYWALDALVHQAGGAEAERLCLTLAPRLARLRPAISPAHVATLLLHDGLPALERRGASPGNRAVLRALMPHAQRFFGEIVPALQVGPITKEIDDLRNGFLLNGRPAFNGYTDGLDVLNALRGLQNMYKESDDNTPLPDVQRILEAIEAAVAARSLGLSYSSRIAQQFSPSGTNDETPQPKSVLASLIHHLRHHFALESARRLTHSVYQWLDFDPAVVPFDPAQLVTPRYRKELITLLVPFASHDET